MNYSDAGYNFHSSKSCLISELSYDNIQYFEPPWYHKVSRAKTCDVRIIKRPVQNMSEYCPLMIELSLGITDYITSSYWILCGDH